MIKAVCIIGLMIILACNQNKKQSVAVEQKTGDTTEITEKEVLPQDPGLAESLAKMAPLTEQEMRDLLPTQLMGVPRLSEDVNGSIGTLTAIGEYQVNDTTRLELLIVDCAGPSGVGVYNMQYLSMLGLEEEDEDEYTRTIDFRGGKAFENCYKTKVECSLTWFEGRYLVSLDGNLSPEQLKKAAGELKF